MCLPAVMVVEERRRLFAHVDDAPADPHGKSFRLCLREDTSINNNCS